MRTIGATVAVAALSAALFAPSPSEAFGLRLGPFYFGLPFIGYRHHRALVRAEKSTGLQDNANLSTAEPASPPAQGGLTSALIYPAVALPVVYDEVFRSPASSPWPFSYDAIFQTAFAKAAPDRVATACQQPDRATDVVDRITTQIRPTPAQQQQLQRLGGALAMAAGYLAKACPNDVPAQPVARLQLMEWQIEKLAQALDMVRQPLQDFEQSLNATQRARFAAALSAAPAIRPDRAVNITAACATTPTAVDASIERISLSVEPTDAQRDALTSLKQAFHDGASELDANCPFAVPGDPLARLEATEARLDATWRAVVAIQVALADFDNGLNDEQRARLDSTDFAAAQ
jgi:LTXXQ motif family protein